MVAYRLWPESWIVNWEPRLQYERNHDFNGVLQDEGIQGRLGFQFAKNVSFYTNVNRDMERYRDVDFWKSRYSFGWTVNTSRRISINGSTWTGDQIRFVDNPYLGSDRQLNLLINVRPLSRLQSEININTSRFVDVRSDTEVFDVKIFRTRTTYQFTNRLLVRNILEYNTFDKTVGKDKYEVVPAPAGPAGWIIPIDPMLAAIRETPAKQALFARLAARAA